MNEAAKILVVDDDANIQKLVCNYLKDQEFLVASAENAKDAYTQIDDFQPSSQNSSVNGRSRDHHADRKR